MHGDEYDESLARFHRTGPEFHGWLSNHGPMAVDALVRVGRGDEVERWTDGYVGKLEQIPPPRFEIPVDGWRDPFGDPSRLGDWLPFFDRLLARASWQEVLTTWFPRLMPGALASATHGLIRTGHVVRSLRERETPVRIAELGQALGYWAARWMPAPPARPAGHATFAAAFHAVPAVADDGGARVRLAALTADPAWAAAVGTAPDVDSPAAVPQALEALVDTAVALYPVWARADPTMLVHMATAPRAALLVLPSLPPSSWPATYRHAWATSAAIAGMYRPATAVATAVTEPVAEPEPAPGSMADAIAAAVATRDEHAIKFAEVGAESAARGNRAAVTAVGAAARLLR